MRKFTKVIYIVSMLACLGGVILHLKMGNSITWPAVALFWCMNAFLTEYKQHEDE